MTIVLDFSNWRPSSPQALKAAGVDGEIAYIKPMRFNWPKAIKPAELAANIAAGVATAFNYENNPGDWRGGAAAGTNNGAEAAEAMRELGLGPDVPLYVSFDEEIQPAEFPAAEVYYKAFVAACGHPIMGGYGENDFTEWLAAHDGLRYGWESESESFPGNDGPKAHTVLVQHFGEQVPGLPGAYDVNTTVHDDWGQYPRPTAPAPVSVQTGGITHDMANAKSQLITTAPLGFGQFVGIFDAGAPVTFAQATVQGPDPHQADASSKDDLWPASIGATARVNVRGNHVVVTVDAPNFKTPGGPSVYVTAVLA